MIRQARDTVGPLLVLAGHRKAPGWLQALGTNVEALDDAQPVSREHLLRVQKRHTTNRATVRTGNAPQHLLSHRRKHVQPTVLSNRGHVRVVHGKRRTGRPVQRAKRIEPVQILKPETLLQLVLVPLSVQRNQTDESLRIGHDTMALPHKLQPAYVPREADLRRTTRNELVLVLLIQPSSVVVPHQLPQLHVVHVQIPAGRNEVARLVVLFRNPPDAGNLLRDERTAHPGRGTFREHRVPQKLSIRKTRWPNFTLCFCLADFWGGGHTRNGGTRRCKTN